MGYPPPTVELATRGVGTRRTIATCLPATDPAILDRTVEIPDLGTMTVADWTPLIIGHITGHATQALDVLRDRGALAEGRCGRPSSPGCTRSGSRTVPSRPPVPAGWWWCG